MKDLARRFVENPLLMPRNLKASSERLQIISLLNPGVFRFEGKTWLLVRVAESIAQKEGVIFFPVWNALGHMEIIEVPLNDPELVSTDVRIVNYKGLDYLTTVSHLRLLVIEDGVHFAEPDQLAASLFGATELERYGIEDCRVSLIEGVYYLTYTAVSASGVGVGLRMTRDWRHFTFNGMILPPHNKDVAIFEEKISGKYFALHRPSSKEIGGNYIWLCESPDGQHWGNHQCILKTRAGHWDSVRVGAGAAPIRTPYVVDGDQLTIYYGAADEFVCGAYFSISKILDAMAFGRER